MESPELSCAGFQENVVLALKNHFYEEEIRCMRIEKLPNQSAVYHARACMSFSETEGLLTSKISKVCNDWFNNLVSPDNSFIIPEQTEKIFDINVSAADDNNEEPNYGTKSPHFIKETGSHPTNIHDVTPVVCSSNLPTLSLNDEFNSNKESIFACKFCEQSFSKKPSLNKHMNRKHRTELLRLEEESGEYICGECGKTFNKYPSLRRHRSRHHVLTSWVCTNGYLTCMIEGCGKPTFTTDDALKAHMKGVHNLPRKGRKPKDPIDLELVKTLQMDLSMKDEVFITPKPCTYCGKIFESKLKLYWHIKRVHQQKHKPCQHCGLMVKKLSDHVKRQHTEKDLKKFVCEFCGDRFKGQSGYQFHIAGHTGEKKYSCGGCGKPFRTSSEAYNCERGHQGIYKWKCSLCSFKSHQKNKYVRHLRTHTKSQPYECPLCDHKAARKDYLQKHIGKSHSYTTLEEVEASHPNLYKIEEKVQVPSVLSYGQVHMNLENKDPDSKVLKDVAPHFDLNNYNLKIEDSKVNAERNKNEVGKRDQTNSHHTFRLSSLQLRNAVSENQYQKVNNLNKNLVQQLNYLTKLPS